MSIWYEGKAADGTHVLITADPYTQRTDCKFLVNGEEAEITEAERYRDGGTTNVQTSKGSFHWPARRKQYGFAGFPAQAVTFAGKTLKEVDHTEARTIKFEDLDKLLQKLAAAGQNPPFWIDDTFRTGWDASLRALRKELNL